MKDTHMKNAHMKDAQMQVILIKDGDVVSSNAAAIEKMASLGKVVHCPGCSTATAKVYHHVRLNESKFIHALARIIDNSVYPDEAIKSLLELIKDINNGKYNLTMEEANKGSSIDDLLADLSSNDEYIDLREVVPNLILGGLLSSLLGYKY